VDGVIATIVLVRPEASMLFKMLHCRCLAGALSNVAGLIRRYHERIGSCRRKLDPGRQPVLVLTHLRKGETLAELAAGVSVGTVVTTWVRRRDRAAAICPVSEAGPGAARG
jgi:hypothetical protein